MIYNTAKAALMVSAASALSIVRCLSAQLLHASGHSHARQSDACLLRTVAVCACLFIAKVVYVYRDGATEKIALTSTPSKLGRHKRYFMHTSVKAR